jgi:hypothetical protein
LHLWFMLPTCSKEKIAPIGGDINYKNIK